MLKNYCINGALFLALFFPFQSAFGQLNDPIPTAIPFSDLRIHLEEFAKIPVGKRGHADNRARINMIREIPDGSGRLAVIDLNGYLYFLDEAGNHSLYLDFRNHFTKFIDSPGKGTGSGAIAFHPKYAENGIFYTTHAEQKGAQAADFVPIDASRITLQWVITRWQTNDLDASTFSGTKKELVRMDFTTAIHGTQDISFNPYAEEGDADYGLLYVCNGEGGASEAGKYQNVANKKSFMGSVWRIDPEGSNSDNGKYGIPADNPFVGEAGSIEEIWAYGFRNPHRMAFEQRDGKTLLFIGDIGQHNIEEVNLIEKGGNYGWDSREGTFDYNRRDKNVYALTGEDEEDFFYPVAQYDHNEGVAVSLGFTWLANHSPKFQGQFFLGDILYGEIFHAPLEALEQGKQFPLQKAMIVTPNGSETIFEDYVTESRVDLRFARLFNGEILLFTKAGGHIYTISDGTSTNPDNATPQALFTLDQEEGDAPLTVTVDASGSSDADGDAMEFKWSFGDGSEDVTGANATHTFTENGSFIIRLTVTDANGYSDYTSRTVTVTGNSVNTPPAASFTVSPEEGAAPLQITVDASGSSDADGDELTYIWDFGDDSEKATGLTAEHTYSVGGDYIITLTVKDENGGSDNEFHTYLVQGVTSAAKPRADDFKFYPNPTSGTLTVFSKVAGRASVWDLSGKLILKPVEITSTKSIDISILTSGTYILMFQEAGKSHHHMLQKN